MLTLAGERVCGLRQRRWHASSSCSRASCGTGAVSGELQIAASTTPGEFVVPRPVAGFQAQVSVRPLAVSISDSARVVEDLRRGTPMLVFVGARSPAGTRILAVAGRRGSARRTHGASLCLSQGGHAR